MALFARWISRALSATCETGHYGPLTLLSQVAMTCVDIKSRQAIIQKYVDV